MKSGLLGSALAAVLLVLLSNGRAGAQITQEQLAAETVVAQDGGSLLTIPGVFQVGVGTDNSGNIVIVVTADEVTPEIQSQAPTTLGGFPVQLEKGPRWVVY